MSTLITYLLFGCFYTLLTDMIARVSGSEDLNGYEKTLSIIAWPLFLLIFIFYFVKGFFLEDDDEQ